MTTTKRIPGSTEGLGALTPDSPGWRVNREILPGAIGGVRALVLQGAHRGLIEGFLAHTDLADLPFREQLPRFMGTLDAVHTLTFEPERAERAWRRVRSMHARVNGA